MIGLTMMSRASRIRTHQPLGPGRSAPLLRYGWCESGLNRLERSAREDERVGIHDVVDVELVLRR